MTKFSIDAKIIRAAMTNQAKLDVRFYLNGILLAKNGDVVGTDGSTLFKSYSQELADAGLESDIIVAIDGTIPKTATQVTFDIAGKQCEAVMTNRNKLLAMTLIDGKYPDYMRVMPDAAKFVINDDKGNALPGACLDANLLARCAVFEACDIRLPNDGLSSVSIVPNGDAWPMGTVLIIMPMHGYESMRPIAGGTAPYKTDNAIAA